MRLLALLTPLLFLAINAQAENSILGKWVDKSNPSANIYEFKENQDFIYTRQWEYQGESKSNKSVGVWEIGAWEVTDSGGSKSSCNLSIYADTKECCFNYKFIANNLILTCKYTDGYGREMCKNRVLIKAK